MTRNLDLLLLGACLTLIPLGAFALSCAGSGQDGTERAPRVHSPSGPPPPPAPLDAFGANRAWTHVEALLGAGPRVTGSAGSAEARKILEAALVDLGAEVHQISTPLAGTDLHGIHVVGIVPGLSDDVVLLSAPYDTWASAGREVLGANDGASGPALVLELARALAERERPYSLWLVFIDGDSVDPGAAEPEHRSLAGSRALASRLAEQSLFDRVRLAVFFNQLADPDLQISRDLRSHRSYREMFWQSARALGHEDVLAGDPAFETPEGSHEAFLDQGLRRVVAIVDDRYGGSESPGFYWRSSDDDLAHVSAESLGIAGELSLDALRNVEARLLKIDRFAERPLSDPAAPPGDRGF